MNEKPYYTGQGFFFIYLEHIFFAQKYLHVPFMAVPTIEADQAVASSYFLKKSKLNKERERERERENID